LHYASLNGFAEVAFVLLQNGANANEKNAVSSIIIE